MYVKIIDRGECFSTTMEYINGVYANKTEWAKHNFYPQNGMVGEIVKRTPSAFIVKIKDGIYVPMTQRGIREITYVEYLQSKDKNVCAGMDERQKRINAQTDSLIGSNWQQLPDMRSAFKTDIIHNMEKLTCDFQCNIYLPDLEESAVIYAADMCLEYRRKSGRVLDPMTIEDIAIQVTDVYQEFFKSQFPSSSKQDCIERTASLVSNPINARRVIDEYYEAVNERYNRI